MTRLQRHAYPTYEGREDAFRRIAGDLIPRRHGGARLFWQDLREASGRGLQAVANRPVARITANPRDCLAFGSARQVLAAALMTAGKPGMLPERISALAEAFGIGGNLGQPIRTLSGGETVKVALAKAAAMLADVDRLVIASPFSWLSRDNHGCLAALLKRYAKAGVPAQILMLEGEDSDQPADPALLPPGPDFALRLTGIRTPLSPAFGVVGRPPALAAVNDFSAGLRSPCLWVGSNGQGKSLVAKILAGAAICEGRAEMRIDSQTAGVRLLFQDILTQTLLRDPETMAAAADKGRDRGTWVLTAAMEEEFGRVRREIAPETEEYRLPVLGRIKIFLAASRLSARPGALILDEPDWGLSRTDAIALVRAVIAAAHRQETAVILISHKPWWTRSAGSVVSVAARRETLRGADHRVALTVRLQAQEADRPGGVT
jgi:energy-coupling factor transporter ATP-binding protein EcfA2